MIKGKIIIYTPIRYENSGIIGDIAKPVSGKSYLTYEGAYKSVNKGCYQFDILETIIETNE